MSDDHLSFFAAHALKAKQNADSAYAEWVAAHARFQAAEAAWTRAPNDTNAMMTWASAKAASDEALQRMTKSRTEADRMSDAAAVAAALAMHAMHGVQR